MKVKFKRCPLTNLPIKVNFGRPDFRKIFEDLSKIVKNDVFVYSCGTKIM